MNPEHLFLGTCADNMADKVAKGRQFKSAPLPPDKTAAILGDYRVWKSLTLESIAEKHGVTIQTVWRIGKGQRNLLAKAAGV